MSRPAIEVSGLSKRYVIEHESRHDNLRDTLHHEARKLWRRLRWGTSFEREEFWALRDVAFSVQPGEAVGIIGRNGAGKSTLLKILSRITEPTSGSIKLRGRVASLLEVGTGFHPDLTGRENIYLNGAILGMSRAEIRAKFDEIVAFAEIERFLDTPVKRYSSGMYVRLAFAVAAHLEPEILIVDEVLAVGDVQFRKKCMGKLRDVTRNSGRTVLFVSHDMSAISALTERCLLLKSGETRFFGPTEQAVGIYLGSGGPDATDYTATKPLGSLPRIAAARIAASETPGVQAATKPMSIELDLEFPAPCAQACLSFQIVNQYDQPATHLWLYGPDRPFGQQAGRVRLRCHLPAVHLNVGHYTLKVYFSEPPGGRSFEILEQICPFEVVRLGATTLWGWRPEACTYHEDGVWDIHHAG